MPSPEKPGGHVHIKLPIVLVQVALGSQLSLPVLHSSISVQFDFFWLSNFGNNNNKSEENTKTTKTIITNWTITFKSCCACWNACHISTEIF